MMLGPLRQSQVTFRLLGMFVVGGMQSVEGRHAGSDAYAAVLAAVGARHGQPKWLVVTGSRMARSWIGVGRAALKCSFGKRNARSFQKSVGMRRIVCVSLIVTMLLERCSRPEHAIFFEHEQGRKAS
jgi:hypothetical protein